MMKCNYNDHECEEKTAINVIAEYLKSTDKCDLCKYVLVINESKLKARKQIIAFKIVTMLLIVL